MEQWRQQAQRARDRQREREQRARAAMATRVREDNLVRLPDRDRADAEPTAGDPPAPPVPAPVRRGLAGLLSSRDALRQAVVLGEVLGPPKGLRPPGSPR